MDNMTSPALSSSAFNAPLQDKIDAAAQSSTTLGAATDKPAVSAVVEDEVASSKDNLPNASSGTVPEPRQKCSYRDFSRVQPEKTDGASSLIAQSTTAKEPTFPVKLHMILSNPEFQDIISWLPHGRSWRILQQKAFEERVIPLYFRHGRYSSFARQVNGWGFRRVTHGSDYNSYYHEMFLRGMPHLCEKMRRLTNKDTAARKKLEDEPAPDFYALSRSHPLPENTPTAVPNLPGSATGPSSFLDVEAALLERRRADFLDRINLLASSNALRQDALTASLRQQPDLLSASLGAQPGLANSLYRPAGLGGMYDNIAGAPAANNAASLQQLLGSRPTNPDMARLLAMNGGSLGGMGGFMGPQFGL